MSDWKGKLTVGLGWVYYNGPVGHTDFHQHYAVQICFPNDGPLHIETPEAQEATQIAERILVIGSNVSHRFSTPGQTATLLYIEPYLVTQNFSRLHIDGIGKITLPKAQLSALKTALAGAPHSEPENIDAQFGQKIANLIWPQNATKDTGSYTVLNPRIRKALADIKAIDDLNIRLSQLAAGSGLSTSRFRRVFSDQVGMSLKSYLLWAKLQRAFRCLATDSSLTNAAHTAGFADSAHLSRTFRRMFGLTPGDLNKNAHFPARNSKK